jgi:glycosyltransferase involved in cell wall biosynthesis
MFSILLPTWNNLPYLRLCIDSIRRHCAMSHQVIVHVNDGSDGTLDWVRAQGIEHTRSGANIGICYAVNEAAMHSRHDWIVYLNDDMVVLPGWDSALLTRAQRLEQLNENPFMLSGTMIEPRETGNRCVVVADYGDSDASFRESDLLRDQPRLARADWLGSTWPPTLVHRRWWFSVGGYSTELSPGMSSDNDFSMKLWHLGCRRFIGVGDALVYHFQCKSTGKVVKNDGRRQFLHKWGLSQSQFDRLCLRRGEALQDDAPLPEPDAPSMQRARRLAGWRRRLL